MDLSLIRANMRLRSRSAPGGLSVSAGPPCGSSSLAETSEPSPLERFCGLLAEAGVEFIVIGGQAEALMGSARVTYDVDLCYRRTSENLKRLARALKHTPADPARAPPDLMFQSTPDLGARSDER